MTVRVVDTEEGLAGLREQWEALWRGVAGAAPFQSPWWMLPWWAVWGTGRPLVGTWWDGERLAGVLPCYVLDEGEGAKLLPMGVGVTDYLDVLGEGAAPMLAAVLGRAAAEGVERCDLVEVPAGSVLPGLEVPAGWEGGWQEGAACPVLTLPGLPKVARRKLQMNRNRAGRAGGWVMRRAEAATLAADWAVLARLHGLRWAEAGEAGVIADPAVGRFHALAGPKLLNAGLLRLSVLEVGGVAAAASLALLGAGRVFLYLSGYDPAQGYVSPGTLLLGAMLEEAVAEGRGEAHFLRGREGYKYGWGAVDRMNRVGWFRRAG